MTVKLPSFDQLRWYDDHVRLGSLLFRLEPRQDGWVHGPEHFILYKQRQTLDEYQRFFRSRPDLTLGNIVELGIWDGGSIALWRELLLPDKIVGIDFNKRSDSEYFRKYVAAERLEDTVKTYWGTNQGDIGALSTIIDREFSQPLDLVIDDASHFYEETKTSFEFLFQRLKEGGVYVIEDWAWPHWPAFDDVPYFAGKKGLNKLIFEIAEMIGSGVPAVMTVSHGVAMIEKLASTTEANEQSSWMESCIHRRPEFCDYLRF